MDPKTVIVILAVHLLGSGLLLCLMSLQMPPRSGLVLWGSAGILFGLAYVGRLSGDLQYPHPATVPVDIAMFAALMLFDVGLRRFLGRESSLWRLPWLVVGFAALHVPVTYLAGATPRFVLLNAVLALGYLRLGLRASYGCRSLPVGDRLRWPLIALATLWGNLGLLTVGRAVIIGKHGSSVQYSDGFAAVYFSIASLTAVMMGLLMVAMVFVRLNARLAELAARDALTGTLNRRGLDDVVARHFGARRDAPLVLLQVDLDHFKRVNDSHGHAAGDALLRAAADVLRAQVRPCDFVARIGGEEFLVGCATGDASVASTLAERLRSGIAALAVVHDAAPLRCTASIGLSRPFERRDHWDAAVAQADGALYEAKAAGRNRCVVSSAGTARAARQDTSQPLLSPTDRSMASNSAAS